MKTDNTMCEQLWPDFGTRSDIRSGAGSDDGCYRAFSVVFLIPR